MLFVNLYGKHRLWQPQPYYQGCFWTQAPPLCCALDGDIKLSPSKVHHRSYFTGNDSIARKQDETWRRRYSSCRWSTAVLLSSCRCTSYPFIVNSCHYTYVFLARVNTFLYFVIGLRCWCPGIGGSKLCSNAESITAYKLRCSSFPCLAAVYSEYLPSSSPGRCRRVKVCSAC